MNTQQDRHLRNMRQGCMSWHFKHRGGMTVPEAMRWFGFETREQAVQAIKRLRKSGLDIREKRIERTEECRWGMVWGGTTSGRKHMIYFYLEGADANGQAESLGA